jgi:putative membrane protein
VRSFLQRWFVTAAGVLVASQIVPGIQAASFPGLLAASLVLGILNAFLRPIMMILSLPLLLLTLGLFTLVINAILLLIVGKLVATFHVAGFWSAFLGGVVISIVSMVANGMIGRPEKKADGSEPRSPSAAPPPQRRSPPPGNGPVIDV